MSETRTELRIPGLVLVEHEFAVPLDHAQPAGEQLTIFAREVADPDGRDRPFLVFLQGGPGFEAPRPGAGASSPPWLARALKDYRVLMLDQRGTGRSTPIGEPPAGTPAELADRLAHFRADSIVADAELIRERLGVDTWSVLGQSFGGFCALRYLSAAPGGLREAFFTGGLPPIGTAIDEIYRTTYEIMRVRNERYYSRYPSDRARVRAIVEQADAGALRLPTGDAITGRWFRQVGNTLGMSDGAERLHYLLELDPRSTAFRHDLLDALPFGGRNPIYSVIHEACYADGQRTGWAAERVMPDDFRSESTMLTGEHVFSWLFTDSSELAPWREAAELLAHRAWPPLYDPAALETCAVPCAAAIYAEDAYVPRRFAEQTAARIPTMHAWLTNEYEHNGLHADGDRVLDRLIALARGRV